VSDNRRNNQVYLQVLLSCVLCIFLAGVFYVITFKRPSVLGLEVLTRANGTRTAIALTSRALYGPFPTATGPTPTITKTPTLTATVTMTPSNTPTPTPFRFFIDTATPRTPIPNSLATSNPPAQATQPPAGPPNTSPPPVQIQPTSPPAQQPPAQATKKACLNPQGHPVPCH
jgi:type VI secretion system secreted protein VgrG